MKILLYAITVISIFVSCEETENPNQYFTKIIGIQPLGSVDSKLLDTVNHSLQLFYGYEVITLPKLELPESAFINVKTPRFRADSIIRLLKKIKPDSINYIIGITEKDISTTKRDKNGNVKKPISKYEDFGIFGLGFCPGNSCVVSTFRYQKNKTKLLDRITKISSHEIGHNLGLKHCPNTDCVMQDAAEKISTIDNVKMKLCKECQNKIK